MWSSLFTVDASGRALHEDFQRVYKESSPSRSFDRRNYITEEAIEFFTNYLSDANFIGVTESRHDGFYDGRGIQGLNVKTFSRQVVLQAHLYIFNNLSEVDPYLTAHKALIKEKYPQMNEKWLWMEHNRTFIDWFNESISNESGASDN